MLNGLKNAFTRAVLRLLRVYVRYGPFHIGKGFLYGRVLMPYLGWRRYEAVATTRRGFKMEIALPDTIQSRIYFFGVWEPQISMFISERLSEGDRFIDIGANIGYYSLLAASVVGKQGRVHAVEASPSIFRRLERNVALSHYENIRLHNVAASDRTSTIKIFLGPERNIGLTTTVAKLGEGEGYTLEAEVRAQTLDVILGREELLTARLIKIDVEGGEFAVIKGLANLFPLFPQQTEWVFELNPQAVEAQGGSAVELFDSFRKAGYRLYQIPNDYTDTDYLRPPKAYRLSELAAAPGAQADIIASKADLTTGYSSAGC